MNRNKILILGGSSFIGRNLITELEKNSDVVPTFFKNKIPNGIYFDSLTMKLDSIVDLNIVTHAIILIGETNPKNCYENIEATTELNVNSIKHIIDDLIKYNIKIIFASSHYVFDGVKGAYTEEDIPNPKLIYGKQKCIIEEYIKEQCKNYLILRIDKVVSSKLQDNTIFSNWINTIHHMEKIYCSTDQKFSPVDVIDVAKSLHSLIDKDLSGVYNVCGQKSIFRVDLLQELIADINIYKKVDVVVIQKKLQEFDGFEDKLLNINLLSDKLIKDTGINLKSVHTTISEVVREYAINKIFFDTNLVNEDKTAKTKSYYCKNDIVGVNHNIINQLLNVSDINDNCDIRLCLHKNSNAPMHSMIIILHKKHHYKPHRHKDRTETYHLIEGEMDILIFDDNGNIIKYDTLSCDSNIIYRMQENTWHAISPKTEYVIFNESKNGPFIRDNDSLFPTWDYA